MSSTASGLNALASTTAIDIYKRNLKEEKSESTISTRQSFYLVLGCCSHSFASVGTLFENLIQLNIVGSIFYGTVLGIFRILHQIRQSQSHLYSALVSQITIFFIYLIFVFPAGEAAGLFMAKLHRAMLTIVLSAILQLSVFRKEKDNIS
jgi:Na+/proline symporter